MRGALTLCLLMSMQACVTSKQAIRPAETIEVAVPTLVALPAAMTTITPEPVMPAPLAVDRDGEPTITNAQLADNRSDWIAYARTLAAKLRAIAGMQPKGE